MVNKTRLVNEFCKLVSIDSLPFRERELADVLIQYLLELGFEVTEDNAGEFYQGNCGNIYGYLEGELKGEPILFSAHLDTVEPGTNKRAIVHDDGTITSDKTSVLGADDLSGIVSILEAIRTIKDKGFSHRRIEVLFTVAEELYLKGSEGFDYQKIRSKQAYVLDLSGPVGTAALKAPTLIFFTVKLLGKASHAGFAPEAGINAIAIAGEVLTRIKQGRIDEFTTVNIGLIEGGTATNIVSDSCTIKGEVRSLNHNTSLAQVQEIKRLIEEVSAKYGSTFVFEQSFGSLAYEIPRDHQVVKQFETVCNELGIETKFISTFGGSDNNHFFQQGIMGIVIACGMNNVHSCEEYTHVEELARCSNIVLELMRSEAEE